MNDRPRAVTRTVGGTVPAEATLEVPSYPRRGTRSLEETLKSVRGLAEQERGARPPFPAGPDDEAGLRVLSPGPGREDPRHIERDVADEAELLRMVGAPALPERPTGVIYRAESVLWGEATLGVALAQ